MTSSTTSKFEEYPIWGETCKFGGRELAFDEGSQVIVLHSRVFSQDFHLAFICRHFSTTNRRDNYAFSFAQIYAKFVQSKLRMSVPTSKS